MTHCIVCLDWMDTPEIGKCDDCEMSDMFDPAYIEMLTCDLINKELQILDREVIDASYKAMRLYMLKRLPAVKVVRLLDEIDNKIAATKQAA